MAAASLLAASWARAAETAPLLKIQWEAPAGCPDAAQVGAEIVAMLASSPHPESSELVARATVISDPEDRFTMRLSIEAKGASESRTIDAETCESLADAFAVIVAFTLDPSAKARTASGGASQSPPAIGVAKELPLPSSEDRGPVTLAAGGPVVALGAGLMPFPAYGLGAAVGLEHGLRWELAASYWPEQSSWVSSAESLDPSHTYGARVGLGWVQPSTCVPLGKGVVGLCAGAEVGGMYAAGTGTGVRVPDSGWSWWLAPVGGAAVRLRVGQALDLRFRVDVGVPVFRPSFVLQNVGPSGSPQAYQPAPVFTSLSFEPEVPFFSTGSPVGRHDHQ